MRVAAIIPAAGAGKRLKTALPKVFVRLAGRPLLLHTLTRLGRAYSFSEWVVVIEKRQIQNARRVLKRVPGLRNLKIVEGGASRAESVWKGLQAVSNSSDWTLVHDAARPLVSRRLVASLLKEARRTGAAICGLPASATVKRVDIKKGVIQNTEDRKTLYLAQTPQVFRKDLLVARYRKLGKKAFSATDEAALFDGTAVKVRMVLGDPANIKITVPQDLKFLAHRLSKRRP